VPIGDVKLYKEQMERTTKQGGSTLEWLSFPIGGDAANAHMRMPASHSHIFHQFILGEYDYLPGNSESSEKQTVRG
jgi:hypothetical protein